jgi:hypothetical protein
MPETAYEGKWRWQDVMRDLEIQGGLKGVIIDPFTVEAHGCGGITAAGTKFVITWIRDIFLLVSMTKEETELIDAFAKVVGYRPFCCYIEKPGVITFEWDKKDPEGRFASLKKEGKNQLKKVQ